MRKAAELKNTLRGQAVTCRLDGPYIDFDGPNGMGNPETLTVLANSKVIVDAAVLKQADVRRRLAPKGPLRVMRQFVPLPTDAPAMYDPTRR